MSQTTDSSATGGPNRPETWGAHERAARATAGLDALAPTTGTGGEAQAGFEDADETASRGPTGDIESMHGDLPGFVDTVDSPGEAGPGRQGVED